MFTDKLKTLIRGNLGPLQDFNPLWCSVLPMLFLVMVVPTAFRSLINSSHVVLGLYLSHDHHHSMRQELAWSSTQRVTNGHFIFLPSSHQASCWCFCCPFQPCAGLQSFPWCPLIALVVVERLEWKKLILWTGGLYTHYRLRLGVSVIECNLSAHSQSMGMSILAGL